MDTLLTRLYSPQPSNEKKKETGYPFWDYRSRRYDQQGETSHNISVRGECAKEADLNATRLDDSGRESLSDSNQHTSAIVTSISASSDAETMDTSFSNMTSASGDDVIKMAVEFAASGDELCKIRELFRPLLDWFDPALPLFRYRTDDFLKDSTLDNTNGISDSLDIPSLALVLFLKEDEDGDAGGSSGGSKVERARQYLSSDPWRFHHREWVAGSGIQAYPESSPPDYVALHPDLPLCSVRQIHCGREHLRVVRFVSQENWTDTVQLYQLLLGQKPSAAKQDFCMYVMDTTPEFDVQLALKKLPRGVVPRHTERATLTLRIPEVGTLVPLLPNVCEKVSDAQWLTLDLDGNELQLEVSNAVGSRTREDIFLTSLGPTLQLLSEEIEHCVSENLEDIHLSEKRRRKRSNSKRSRRSSSQSTADSVPSSQTTSSTLLAINISQRECAEKDCSHVHCDSGFVETIDPDSVLNESRVSVSGPDANCCCSPKHQPGECGGGWRCGASKERCRSSKNSHVPKNTSQKEHAMYTNKNHEKPSGKAVENHGEELLVLAQPALPQANGKHQHSQATSATVWKGSLGDSSHQSPLPKQQMTNNQAASPPPKDRLKQHPPISQTPRPPPPAYKPPPPINHHRPKPQTLPDSAPHVSLCHKRDRDSGFGSFSTDQPSLSPPPYRNGHVRHTPDLISSATAKLVNRRRSARTSGSASASSVCSASDAFISEEEDIPLNPDDSIFFDDASSVYSEAAIDCPNPVDIKHKGTRFTRYCISPKQEKKAESKSVLAKVQSPKVLKKVRFDDSSVSQMQHTNGKKPVDGDKDFRSATNETKGVLKSSGHNTHTGRTDLPANVSKWVIYHERGTQSGFYI